MSATALIVDDDKQKIQKVVDCLCKSGFQRNGIEVAQSGVEARRLLESSKFDLLVLDIALPFRAEENPDPVGGIRLFEELTERKKYLLPVHVLGLTQYDDLYAEHIGQFHSHLWSLEKYSPTESGWLSRLEAKARYIIAEQLSLPGRTYQIDLCVISALPVPELEYIKSLPWGWREPIALDEVAFAYEGAFRSGSIGCSVIAAAAPRPGIVASALLAYKLITKYRPRLLIMAGICAGFSDSCEIGDVIVADPAWDWQMGKYYAGEFSISPDQIAVSPEVMQRFAQMQHDRQLLFAIQDEFTGEKPNQLLKIHTGPFVSGSAVLADDQLLKRIRAQHRKVIGLDMETYGVYAAARDSGPPRPRTVSVKGVSDFGDSRKADRYQRYAAYCSARVVQLFSERFASDFRNLPL